LASPVFFFCIILLNHSLVFVILLTLRSYTQSRNTAISYLHCVHSSYLYHTWHTACYSGTCTMATILDFCHLRARPPTKIGKCSDKSYHSCTLAKLLLGCKPVSKTI